MEVILSYLENMFMNMPRTSEVLRAKDELASMMEDKYNELLAEGKKKNEAIGIVISEFGDLEELKQELGLDQSEKNTAQYNETHADFGGVGDQKKNANYEKSVRIVSRQEAEEYIEISAKTSKWIAVGVMLCIWSPICLLFWGGVDESINEMSDFSMTLLGIVPLLVMIGVAVAIFIYNGTKIEKYEYLKKENIQLDMDFRTELSRRAEKDDPAATIKIIIGVVLCIFSVVVCMLFGSLSYNSVSDAMGVIFLLFMIGIAVMFFITGGTKKDCYNILMQENEYSVDRKKKKKLIDTIAGIYWPIVTVIYFIMSFLSGAWGRTWIIWVIAGVSFGAIAAICEIADNLNQQ